MWRLWVTAVAVPVIVCGCSTVHRRPVDVDLPVAERHFIVMDGGRGAETTRRPHPQDAASAAVVDFCAVAGTS
jgi:hypothetical protein